MPFSWSVLALVAVLTLALFLSVLNYFLWLIQRDDKTPLWLTAWLSACVVFVLCRLAQFASLDNTFYIVVPRILLSASYVLAWMGYELANTFIGYRPTRREHAIFALLMAAPVLILWSSNLILTDQIVIRTILGGGEFHGVMVGFLYLPANFLILSLGIIPLLRLIRASGVYYRRDNILLAMGYLFVILFSLNDFLATAFNYVWLRLSDYSYLPMAIFFTYIQVQRFGRLYKNLDIRVQERTIELSRANESLHVEINERKQIEEARRVSEERYSKLIDNARDMIFTLATDGVITSLNPSFEIATGLLRSDWIGRPFEAMILEEDCLRARAQIERILEGESIGVFRLHLITRTGKMLVVEMNISLQIKGNQVIGLLGIARDMTEEQFALDALKASEQRFRALIENSADAVSFLDAEGKILYASPATDRVLSFTAEEIIGHNIFEFLHPDDQANVSNLFCQLLQTPGSMLSTQIRYQHKAGGWHWYDGIGHNLLDEPDVKAIVVNYRDITDHKQAEEKIRHYAAEMTALYETTHDLVIERDLSKLLHTIVERAAGLMKASGGGLYLCDPEKRQVRCVVSYNTPHDYTGVVLKYGEGSAGLVAETGEPLLVEDYRTWTGRAVIYEQDRPFISLISVPMRWQDRMIGVIHILDNARPYAFTREDIRIVTLFANQAAIAIENSHLFELEQDRRQETAAMVEVGRDISASLQLEVVLERIASHAKSLLRAETSAVYLSEPQEPILRAVAAIGPDADEIKQDPLNLGEGILGNIALRKVGEIVNDTIADPRAIAIKGTELSPLEHLMGVPVFSKTHLTGLIAVWRIGKEQDFKSTDLDFLSSLAGQVGAAIENARLYEETQKRLREMEILQTIASSLRITQTLNEALPVILNLLMELLHIGGASMELLSPSTGEIVTELACGKWAPVTGMRTPANVGASGRVLATCQPYISTNVIADGYIARPDLVDGLNSVAIVPISAQHQPIGALWVGKQDTASFSKEEVNLLIALGEMVGNTIQRMKLHEQTERQADEIMLAYDHTLEGWAKALELRDKETETHSRRVTDLTLQLARKFGISDPELIHVRRGVLLHDIGKLGIPDHILRKTAGLSAEEWIEMKKHPQYAYDLIFPITYLRPTLDIIHNHHEHWDGSGYPRGLKNDEIPLAARIFTVVDVYDALSSDRSYRPAWPKIKVLNYLQEQSGKLFDPRIVDAFLQLV